MEPILLVNIAAHSAQAALIVGVGSLLPWLFRVDAPSFRYVYWRALLAACLLLRLLQGWQTPAAAQSMAISISNVAPTAVVEPTSRFASTNWLFIAAAAVAGGVPMRGAWMTMSLLHLRRLR